MIYTYVGIVLVRMDGTVLAQHRDNNPLIPEPNKWGICGGKMEDTVDPSEELAAIRELEEETGYHVNPEDLILIGGDEFNAGRDRVVRKFFCAPYDGVQPIQCFEGQEIRFVQLSELPQLDFCEEYHRDYLRRASESVINRLVEGNKQRRK